MSERKATIRKDIAAAHSETWAVLSALPARSYSLSVHPTEIDGWTVHQVIAHLADAENGLLAQAIRVAQGTPAVSPGFDRDRWNRSAVRRRSRSPVPELLLEVRAAHQRTLAFLNDVDEADLDRRGIGSMGLELDVEGFLRRIAEHRREHVAEIQRALGP